MEGEGIKNVGEAERGGDKEKGNNFHFFCFEKSKPVFNSRARRGRGGRERNLKNFLKTNPRKAQKALDLDSKIIQSSSVIRFKRKLIFFLFIFIFSVPDHFRPRVCSLPEKPFNPRAGDDLYRLRTFSITKGTVINCGDSIINRRSRSNTSVNSAGTR